MMGGSAVMWVPWIFVPLLVIAITVAIVLLVVAFTRRGRPRQTTTSSQHGPAREILDQRFARGEIDHDDYFRRRNELG